MRNSAHVFAPMGKWLNGSGNSQRYVLVMSNGTV